MNIMELNGVQNANEINRLKDELRKLDYIGIKIATGVASREDYADEIARAEMIRTRIRALEDKE